MTTADHCAARAPYDVAVVGAGPAGLSAAVAAADAGARIALIDGAGRPGGQFWRTGEADPEPHLHHGREFRRLQANMAGEQVSWFGHHHVQTIHPVAGGWQLRCVLGAEPRASGEVAVITASRVVLATGAYDRQTPCAGWDLPGVMTVGGVQALAKGHGVLAGQSIVVAGTGPFLFAVAADLVERGARVPVVVEANSPAGFLGHPRSVLGAPAKLVEAARYVARLARARTRYRRRHCVVRAIGADRLEAVEIARLDRRGRLAARPTQIVACDVLALGWGFTPQLELHLQAGCATTVGVDGSLVVEVDDDQRTSVDGVWAAGESTGVGGAELAVVEGRIAGRAAAGARPAAADRTRRRRLREFAAALHTVHQVPSFWVSEMADEVVVCRCEEVTAGAIRVAVRDWGASDARTVKLLARTGMGWCQGRVCGYATAAMTAAACGRAVTAGDLRAFAERPFAVPASLGLLADSPKPIDHVQPVDPG
jgi:thioredoxin reductase